jgi:predicted ribosomally synthesized peptide with SipW-like signal peptide
MSKMTNTKRYLVLLAAVGLIAAGLGGTGTFASFTAQTTNPGNTFATGTLLLSNTVGTGSACHSESNTANAATCSAVFTVTNSGTSHEEHNTVTVENTGTLTSGALTLAGTTCVPSTAVTATGLTQNGDPCTALHISIEEDNAVGGTALSCVVGHGTGNTCDPADAAAPTLASWLTGTQTAPLSLVSSLAPTTPHYYKISLYLGDVGNTYQGRAATFDLTWHLQG